MGGSGLEKSLHISAKSLYQRAYRGKAQGEDLASCLQCQKARRKRQASGQAQRGTLFRRTGIDQRPAVVEQRSRVGDWEPTRSLVRTIHPAA